MGKLEDFKAYFSEYLKATTPDELKAIEKDSVSSSNMYADKADLLLDLADSEDAEVTTVDATRLRDMIDFLKSEDLFYAWPGNKGVIFWAWDTPFEMKHPKPHDSFFLMPGHV